MMRAREEGEDRFVFRAAPEERRPYALASERPLLLAERGGGKMDIHKPNGPIHGWREFVGEVGIIVLGVLIALAAEQTVQGLEWAHKVRLATEAMRSELGDDDGPQIYQRAMMHPCLYARLNALRAAVEGGAPRPEVVRLADSYRVEFLTFDSLAQANAVASGVTAHMRPETLDALNSVYALMPLLDRTHGREAQDIARLRALRRTGGPLSDAERDRLLEGVEALRGDEEVIWAGVRWTLPRIKAMGIKLDPRAVEVVTDWTSRNYPECPRELPPNWRRQP